MTSRNKIPAYLKIEQHLQELIRAGAGRTEPLPPEPELADKFNVSRMTARQAYQRLANAGVIVRRRGAGSFVAGHFLEELPVVGVPDFSGWTHGTETSREVDEYGIVIAPAAVAAALSLPKGAKVTRMQRRRIIHGVPCLDIRYMPAAVHSQVSLQDIERESVITVLKRLGFDIVAGQVEIDAHPATRDEARRLGVEIGYPLLERRVLYRDASGAGILTGSSRYPGGKAYTFRFEFQTHTREDTQAARKTG